MPGIGGSLGMCALCGECFAVEIMLGKGVKSFTQVGCSTTFYGHDKCLEDAKGCKTLLDLPEKSPLRLAYEKQEAENVSPSGRRASE
jgi:hypothetical protein